MKRRTGSFLSPVAAVDEQRPKRPASLYVHIPFCASRCGYCTFTSSLYSGRQADAYLDALDKEAAAWEYFSPAFPPQTIFIGGGTPSVLSLPQLKKLFSFLPHCDGEVTCEINPDSCTRDKLLLLRDHGVNRLSFGVQTFDPDGLRLLQRRHSWEQAVETVAMAAGMGFARISVDLINGWPGQTPACAIKDIEIAVNLGIHHLSNYNLILEPSAPGYDRFRALLGGEIADEETGKRLWDICEQTLELKGFKHYETSNFSLPGMECVHNVMTWQGEDYLGLGAGACSHAAGLRWSNVTDIDAYCRADGDRGALVAFSEKLDGMAKARECAVFWLRLFDGVDMDRFFARTGVDFLQLYQDVLPGLEVEGIIERTASHVRVAKEFHPVLDMILEYFV